MVIEIPPKTGQGTVNDAFFGFVIDTGPPGPDRAKGGEYLILPPGHDGEVPEGYFTIESPTYRWWLGLWSSMKQGAEAAYDVFAHGLKIYPPIRSYAALGSDVIPPFTAALWVDKEVT